MKRLTQYLENSYTAYHAVENAKRLLIENGFLRISEREAWNVRPNGKYFVERESALIAFSVGKKAEEYPFSIIASHLDSPALKIKSNPIVKTENYYKLNVEKYGGGILYSFLDKPLKIAGRIIVENEKGNLESKTYVSDYALSIPSVAIHMNRGINDGLTLNPQIDLCPLFSSASFGDPDFLGSLTKEKVVDYDLYLVNAESGFPFGINQEFFASPRVDNLTSAFASLTSLINAKNENGIKMIALFDSEEIGNQTPEGAASDFLEKTMKLASNSLGVKEDAYARALSKSFFLSLDVAHAVHPNHPEKHDPTNRTSLGGGVVIKYNSNKTYVTDAKSAAVIKTIFNKADVRWQAFYNRSDMPGGSTLGRSFLTRVGMLGADVGLPQLAMHSATESFAVSDYFELEKGLLSFFNSNIEIKDEEICLS